VGQFIKVTLCGENTSLKHSFISGSKTGLEGQCKVPYFQDVTISEEKMKGRILG
jgi:hypothetical protein